MEVPLGSVQSHLVQGQGGTASLPGGRNSINPHFVIPTLISLVVTQLVTCWQKRRAPSKEGQIPAASSANSAQPTVRVDCCHVLTVPCGDQSPTLHCPLCQVINEDVETVWVRGGNLATLPAVSHMSPSRGYLHLLPPGPELCYCDKVRV